MEFFLPLVSPCVWPAVLLQVVVNPILLESPLFVALVVSVATVVEVACSTGSVATRVGEFV